MSEGDKYFAEGDCSAVSILLPEVDQLFGGLRSAYDPAWKEGSVAHISLLYPFIEPAKISDQAVQKLRKTAQNWPAFDLEILGLCGFPHALYLAIEPHEVLLEMHRDLKRTFPGINHYRTDWPDDPVFHIAVVRSDNPFLLDQAVQDYLDMALEMPLKIPVRNISLCLKLDGRWQALPESLISTPGYP